MAMNARECEQAVSILRRIDRRFNRIEHDLNVINARLGHMEVMVEDMQWTLGLCEEHIGNMECSMGRIEKRLDRLGV